MVHSYMESIKSLSAILYKMVTYVTLMDGNTFTDVQLVLITRSTFKAQIISIILL